MKRLRRSLGPSLRGRLPRGVRRFSAVVVLCSAGVALAEPTDFASSTPQASTYVTTNFVLLHDQDEGWAAGLVRFLEYGYARFEVELEGAGFTLSPPAKPLTWLCFRSHAAFTRYASQVDHSDLGNLDAYYSARTNRVAFVWPGAPGDAASAPPSEGSPAMEHVPPDIPATAEPGQVARRLSHELAHHVAYNRGILVRGRAYPMWISEGVATCLEFSSTGKESEPIWQLRLKRLEQAGKLIPLRRLLVDMQGDYADMERTRDLYAQSWGFFRFMLEARPQPLRTCLAKLGEARDEACFDTPQLQDFIDTFGPIAPLEQGWHAYVRALP